MTLPPHTLELADSIQKIPTKRTWNITTLQKLHKVSYCSRLIKKIQLRILF